MGIINGFECIICDEKFSVDEYDDTGVNKCPSCGQVYNYDEGLIIELTKEQLTALKRLNDAKM